MRQRPPAGVLPQTERKTRRSSDLVTLPKGFNGNVTLSAEGATSTVGSAACPSGNEAATTSGCVTADRTEDTTLFRSRHASEGLQRQCDIECRGCNLDCRQCRMPKRQ